MLTLFLLLFIFQITYSYKTQPTSYLCTDSTDSTPPTFPSCLPGYVLDIENVMYESTINNLCSGLTLCQIENKNIFSFACNRKRTCQIDINTLRFHINSTCGTTVRFYTYYRCLPVIQEQKDYLCESPSAIQRRIPLGDINLACERNYRLYITKALIGISLKQQDDMITTKNRFKCNKDTQSTCNYNIPYAYRDICDNQSKDQCKIKYNDRPMLKDCQYGMTSNYSMVEYSCIPSEEITEDLPRIDICSVDISERISVDRGLLHSPNYPQSIPCKKQLYVPRESRLRLFMLEKSHEIHAHLLHRHQMLDLNELIDIKHSNDETVQFELRTNSKFLIYFQVDSSISEYAPFILEQDGNQRGKRLLKRYWGIIIGCIIGFLLLLLVIVAVFTILRLAKRRRERSLRYLKSDDNHRERLNMPLAVPDSKSLQVEQPYLASSSPAILPSSNGNRPHSASSTTSSIIMHQSNDGISDCESLIKPINQLQSRPTADIDNLYEEIKEQQQQTAIALGLNGNKSAQPIRDHHENETRYQQPTSSDVPKRTKKPPPKPPQQHPQPSAPPFHLIENDDSNAH